MYSFDVCAGIYLILGAIAFGIILYRMSRRR